MSIGDDIKRILITGGGTGGHVYPALATIEALQEQGNFEFLYVGGKDGIETRLVPRDKIWMETLWIAGFMRSLALKNLLFPFKLLASLYKSWRIIRRFKPHIAVGMGGYVTGPVLYIAAKLRIPVLIQEQDLYPGVTTRLLAKYVDRICLSFEGATKYLTKFLKKTIVTGNPVRKDLLQLNRDTALQKWGFDRQKLTILIFGGSQGARSINLAMLKILPELIKSYSFQMIWQTGEKQYDSVRVAADFDQANIRILPYIQDMPDAYAVADIIVCRAGASSLAELAVVGRATILVPYPYAAGKHQEHNSRMMEEAGAALMVLEGEGWEEKLQTALEKLLSDPDLRQQQSLAWKKMARPNAAQQISEEIITLMDGNLACA